MKKEEIKREVIGVEIDVKSVKSVILKNGKVIYSGQQFWEPDKIEKGEKLVKVIKDLIQQTGQKADRIDAIGIGWDGVVIKNRIPVKSPMTKELTDDDFKKTITPLADTFLDEFRVPVTIATTAQARALKAIIESDRKIESTLFITGYDLRGGYVNDKGELDWGILGELGKIIIDMNPNAPRDPETGVPGTLNQYVSPLGIERAASFRGMGNLKYEEIVERFEKDDLNAKQVLEEIGMYLAEAITEIHSMFEGAIPKMLLKNVIVSNGIFRGRAGTTIIEAAKRILREKPGLKVNLVLSSDELAGAKGAAYLALQEIEIPDDTMIQLHRWSLALRTSMEIRDKDGDWTKEEESILRLIDEARKERRLVKFVSEMREILRENSIHAVKETPNGLCLELTEQPSWGTVAGIVSSIKFLVHQPLTGIDSDEVRAIRERWENEWRKFKGKAIDEIKSNPQYTEILGERCMKQCMVAMDESMSPDSKVRAAAVEKLYAAYKDDPRWPTKEGLDIAEAIENITSAMRIGESDLRILHRLNDLNLGANLRRRFP